MDLIQQQQYERLKSLLTDYGSVLIGFSGGVDSTLLAAAATEALGDRALCVTVDSPLNPRAEVREAVELAEKLGLRLARLEMDALAVDEVAANPPDRCYHCKLALFSAMTELARERGLRAVVDGSNADDDDDYRPGERALRELGVRGPLRELGLTKSDVRAISRWMNLPTWDKPSRACLASRIPYGRPLTREVLAQVEQAEEVLLEMGFRQFRVRHHDDIARVEVAPEEMDRLLDPQLRARVTERLVSLGYTYVACDLVGYRTGSLNQRLLAGGERT